MDAPTPQYYSAIVTKKDKLTEKVLFFTLKLASPPTLRFVAGQYAAFLIDGKTRRQYSFCSDPKDTARFELVIDTSPMGPGSKFFLEKNIGDTVKVMAPLGMFVLDKTTHRKKVMVATGTGIAPFRSMILDYLVQGGTDDVTLYWGMRHEEDLYWVGEFQKLSHTYPNFRFILTLSKPQDSWQGKQGRVTEHVIQEEHNLAGTDYYLCGNRMMIKDIETQLLAKGVPVVQIHKEMYF